MTPKSRTTKRGGGRFSTLAQLIRGVLQRTGEKTCAELKPWFPGATMEQLSAACMELCNSQPPTVEFNGAKYVAIAEHAEQPVASKSRRK